MAKKVFVISDEIYEKLIYGGEKHFSIGSLDKEIKDLLSPIDFIEKLKEPLTTPEPENEQDYEDLDSIEEETDPFPKEISEQKVPDDQDFDAF